MKVIKNIKVVGFVALFIVLLVFINTGEDKKNNRPNPTQKSISINTVIQAHTTALTEHEARLQVFQQLTLQFQEVASKTSLIEAYQQDKDVSPQLVEKTLGLTTFKWQGVDVITHKVPEGFAATAALDYTAMLSFQKELQESEPTIKEELVRYQQSTELEKIRLAGQLITQLNQHLQQYVIFKTLTGIDNTQLNNDELSYLKSHTTTLYELTNFIETIKARTTHEPKVVAALLFSALQTNNTPSLQNIITCPIFSEEGSWLPLSKPIYREVNQLLNSSSNLTEPQYWLVAKAQTKPLSSTPQLSPKNNIGNTSAGSHSPNSVPPNSVAIEYQLIDRENNSLLKQTFNVIVDESSWEFHTPQLDSVLATIEYDFKNLKGEPILKSPETSRQLYALLKQQLGNSKSVIEQDRCRSIAGLNSEAIIKTYGATELANIKISGQISTFTLRPDPKEHEFALVNITYTLKDLFNPQWESQRKFIGKQYPIGIEHEAFIAATNNAFRKLR